MLYLGHAHLIGSSAEDHLDWSTNIYLKPMDSKFTYL